MLAKQQKDDKGMPPRWTLSSSAPSVSWGKSVEAKAPEVKDERWGEIDAKFKGKTLHQIFDMYDTDKSGIIGGFEVAAVLKDAAGEHVPGTATAALEQFGQVDADGNGSLDFVQFCELWRFLHADDGQFQKDGHVDTVTEIFYSLDTDGGGTLGVAQIQTYLNEEAKMKVDEAWVSDLLRDFHRYDANGDGGLDLDEFRELHLMAVAKKQESEGFVSSFSQREMAVLGNSTLTIDATAASAMADASQYQGSTSEEKKGLFARKKKKADPPAQAAVDPNSWGVQRRSTPDEQVVEIIADRLSELGAFSTSGLFRESGSVSEVEDLEQRLVALGSRESAGSIKDVLSECRDVHVLTALFRRWLRTIIQKTPLVPAELIPASESLSEACKPSMGKECATAAVIRFRDQLPSPALVQAIVGVLQKTAAAESLTRMNAVNLGKVFAPTLIHREQAEFAKVDVDARTIALLIQFLPGALLSTPSPTDLAAELREKRGIAGGGGTELREIFDRYDINGDGVLQDDEVATILRERSATGIMDPENALRIFGRYDTDGSGGLEFEEFIQLWHAVSDAKVDPDWIPPPPQNDSGRGPPTDNLSEFTTAWSDVIKGHDVEIASDGSNAGKNVATQHGDAQSVWSDAALPAEGKHYFEVTFNMPGTGRGDTLKGTYFVGVVDHTRVKDKVLRSKEGAWGLCDDGNDKRCHIFANGKPKAAVDERALNNAGRAFGNKERVGVYADMDISPRVLHFYRDGVPIQGASVVGFPSNVRIAATPRHKGCTATITFGVGEDEVYEEAVPPEEAPADDEATSAFNHYNRNGDGLLDMEELGWLLEDAAYHADSSYVDGLAGMFGKWDEDGSGGIELPEVSPQNPRDVNSNSSNSDYSQAICHCL